MSVLLFFIILSVLVIVHELGHFAVAKSAGIRVDEFGLGYPPRAAKLFSWKGTLFSLNWLPFGGFVKIFGENYADVNAPKTPDSFQYKNRAIQAAVLVAGVVGNWLFAALLFIVGFMVGLPAPQGIGLPITNPQTVITQVLPETPASGAGLKSGDSILSLSRGSASVSQPISPETASQFITKSAEPITISIQRGSEVLTKTVTPVKGVVSENLAIGIAMEVIGEVKLPFWQSIKEGLRTTIDLTKATAVGLVTFFAQAILGRADLSAVTGPVGLVGIVGDVSQLGFSHLIAFTALISINLCLINLMPFPALDGGRLLFVGIEALTRKQIPPRVFNLINSAGFILLIFLMILITIKDVRGIL
jgi:regulator of sigma E protease